MKRFVAVAKQKLYAKIEAIRMLPFYFLNINRFCPLGCYRPIKNISLHAKFSQKSLILGKKVNLN